MARQPELDQWIQNVVREEVTHALSPFTEALTRLNQLIGIRRGPGRPPKAAGWGRTGSNRVAVGRRKPGRPATRRVARANNGDASKFEDGQTVKYKQGRGEFEAKVVAIDKEANLVTVQRAKDKKRVIRPASKIYAA